MSWRAILEFLRPIPVVFRYRDVENEHLERRIDVALRLIADLDAELQNHRREGHGHAGDRRAF